MKKVIYNLVQYGTLLTVMLSFGYVALPQEYKDMIPELNELSVVIAGLFSGGTFTTILWVNDKLNKNEQKNDEKVNSVATSQLQIVELLNLFIDKVDLLNKNDESRENQTSDLKNEVAKLVELQLLNLNTKANSNLLDVKSKELIQQTLNKYRGVDNENEEEIEPTI